MIIEDFDGKTFVAFLDISGFKELMKEGKAADAMDRFYQAGYEYHATHHEVEGIFISDCGILFVRTGYSIEQKLNTILRVIKYINRSMIDYDFMLTTSIAFGQFVYRKKIEIRGISKNAIYGNAYVDAFMNNENGLPKLQPGQCRLVKEYLPKELNLNHQLFDEFKFLKPKGNDKKHLYYYWNLNNFEDISEFEKEYNDSYKWKFQGMLTALKKTYNNSITN